MGKWTRPGWRARLSAHAPHYVGWLAAQRVSCTALERIADELCRFLLARLRDRAAAAQFVAALPDVLGKCNDDIYDRPMRAEAYAYVHLLERYRRAWRVLTELARCKQLPLAIRGVRALDVGTGPAPVLYAVNDFYGALAEFCSERGIEELRVPPPELYALERSKGMQRFTHDFSEATGRRGPFGATFEEFDKFDPSGDRRRALEAAISEAERDFDTSRSFASAWVHENEGWRQGLHTYRLCVFANFLTTEEFAAQNSSRVQAALASVTTGGVIVVLGSTHRSYERIYELLDSIAADEQLVPVRVARVFEQPNPDPDAGTIKTAYTRVWQRLEELDGVPSDLAAVPQDIWNPTAPYVVPAFSVRAYGRGRRSAATRLR